MADGQFGMFRRGQVLIVRLSDGRSLNLGMDGIWARPGTKRAEQLERACAYLQSLGGTH